jgi:hypothetical protein
MSLSPSLIIGWESPGSALLLDYLRLVLKVPEKENSFSWLVNIT